MKYIHTETIFDEHGYIYQDGIQLMTPITEEEFNEEKKNVTINSHRKPLNFHLSDETIKLLEEETGKNIDELRNKPIKFK